ncbi:MAG: DUF6923 family protein [Mycetocola sp.]
MAIIRRHRATAVRSPHSSRGTRRRLIGLATATALLSSTLVAVGAVGASAAPGDPFSPDNPTVFIAQGNPSQLYRAETSGSGTFAFSPEGTTGNISYNAIGFNPADNFIYGMVTSSTGAIPAGALVRVGEDGRYTRVGTEIYTHPGSGGSTRFYSGAFNPADGLFYVSDSGPNTTMLAIDVSTGDVVRTIRFSENPGVQDFAFRDGFAWGAASDGKIRRFDLSSGTITDFPGVLPATDGGYGAAWNFGNGNLGYSANSTGRVTQIAITNPASASPTFTIVSTTAGPSSSLNDGTSIPGRPVDLSLDKTGPATFITGDRISYTLTVTNNGPGTSSGWVVTDTLPSGLSNIEVSGGGTGSVSGNTVTVSGGRLAVGETRDIRISADTTVAPGDCITNTALVLGNELDEDEDNNTGSAESCALRVPALDLTKTSDFTADSRPGDTITYTVSATNTGTGDYTTSDPAVIFDDLSDVLDDAEYNGDLAADRTGDTGEALPLLSWSGALPIGETVTLSYSVTLASGGDGLVRNVAWEPEDPEITTPPTCDPRTDEGHDATTGEACASTEGLLPKLRVAKSSDVSSLPAVGKTATYTITVTNDGPGEFTAEDPATMTDDMSKVLDDAELVDGSLTASTGDVERSGTELSWTGALAAGSSATISYTVRYTGEGDRELLNLACVPELNLAAGQDPCATVSVPGSGLQQWKTVEASSDPAVAGSTLEYTLHFTNEGPAQAEISSYDMLTHVLDDAEVTTGPSSDDLSATLDGDRIHVTGTLDAGASATVSYTVTIKPDGERGDDIAANFLIPDTGDTPPEPPTSPECEPAEGETPLCTTTPIGAIEYEKTVSANSDPVGTGTVLEYVVEIRSTGTATMPVDRDDVLADVLDDATVLSGPVSDTESVTVTSIEDDRFSIAGTLAGGETATVRYSVTINPISERGNNSADNFLVPAGENPPEECTADSSECTVTPLPNIDVVKTVDPASGEIVVAGQELSYTLTFTNDGQAAGAVAFSDDLSGVLDDAELTGSPSSEALEVSEVSDGVFDVTGSLNPGESATVVYTVTVKADGERGDNVLRNVAFETDTTPPAECADDDTRCTSNPVPELVDSKSVTPASGTPVTVGQELTYTLTFSNIGAGAGTVDRIDNLTHVLDDADLVSEPVSSDSALTVTRDGAQIRIGGSLAAGQTETVSYTILVRAADERGDSVLANFLLNPGQDVPETPVCEPTDGERADCTINPIGDLAPSKTVDPESGTTVSVGDTLSYTLSFRNTGAAAAEINYVDHLGDVLDDARLDGDVRSTGGAATSGPADGALTITGSVQPGETATVTYRVVVESGGNGTANNFLVPAGQDPATSCVDENPLCTTNPITPPGALAWTGGTLPVAAILAGLVLLIAGAGVVLLRRRASVDGSELTQI